MSDNKKYYYMKVKETFFDSEEMKILEAQQNGIEYQLFYMKICLLSLKSEGALIFKEILPYDITMLSTVTRTNIDTVKTALAIFQKIGLIKILDNETIYMTDIQSLVGKSSTEAERQKEYRYRISRKNVTNVTSKIQNRTPESEIDSYSYIESYKECREETALSPVLDSNFDLETTILKAVQKFGLMCSSFQQVVCFRSPQNKERLDKAIKNARYDIETCIDYALKNTLEQLKTRPNTKPIFEFRDSLYLYLANGYKNEIPRNYSKEELQAKLIEKEKRELEQKEREEQETQACALEVARYEQETAMLFDIEIGDVEAFSRKYEGGMIAFFDERRRREEINNQEVKTKEECTK